VPKEPAQGSAYIPMDSWVYPAMMRLYSMGFLDTAFIGMRPWTRQSAVHMLRQSRQSILDSNNEQAQDIFDKLMHEFEAEAPVGNATRGVVYGLQSVYTRFMGIGGPVLRDRLWFFTAGRFQTDTLAQQLFKPVLTPYDRVTLRRRFEGKGTYSLSPGQTIRVAYVNNYTRTYERFQSIANAGDPTSNLSTLQTAEAERISKSEYDARLTAGRLGQNRVRADVLSDGTSTNNEPVAATSSSGAGRFESPFSRGLLGGLLGLLVGVGIALVADRVDRRVRTREEFETAYGMPVQRAIDAPRLATRSFPDSFWPHPDAPGVLEVERRMPAATRDALDEA